MLNVGATAFLWGVILSEAKDLCSSLDVHQSFRMPATFLNVLT